MAALTGNHRDRLIEATVAEFASVGYERASLNRIIQAAGISKSSFYHAVGSKAELLDAVVETLIADVRAHWVAPDPAQFAGDDFWPRLDGVLTDLGRLAAFDPALGLLGRIFYLPAAGGIDARTTLLDAVHAWVAEVLQVGVRTGAVRDDVPVEALAAATFGMLRGLDEWALDATAEEASRRARDQAAVPGMLLRGMLGRPSSAA
ncbi:TetR/AcrR family transcriptional regulator [Microbacterium aurugineum]|uniref:TetR/AcrR family transcriptional regulator n=1 Tax=Microbacterium aurugineum TaxID=2851642 RepID=UPI0039BDD0C1